MCGAGGGDHEECNETYIGEAERLFKARFLEHKRTRYINMDEAQILDRDPDWFTRGVWEAIYIRADKPTLNKDGGR